MNDQFDDPSEAAVRSDAAARRSMLPAHRISSYGAAPMVRGIERAVAEAVGFAARGIDHPRVHAIVAPVAQPLVANVAAALRIDVSMTTDADEVEPMVAASDALLVNLGMLDGDRRQGIIAAVRAARAFVLDPVKVDRSPERLAFARELLAYGPKVVKGNAAEMAALGPLPKGTVGLTTGARDRIERDGTRVELSNGTALLDQMIATGCAAGLLVAAQLATHGDPLLAAIAGTTHLAIAGELAASDAHTLGPGSFAVRLLDDLAHLTRDQVFARLVLSRGAPDPRLYLLLGPDVADPVGLVNEAVAGGVSLVQWRDKTGGTADQVAIVRRLVAECGVPIVVNDRADVAAIAGADAIHVGHGDLTPAEASRLTGLPVGATIHSIAEANEMARHEIAYASVGGVFETTSKVNPNPPIAIEGFAKIAERVRALRRPCPVVAIAGIDADRARSLARAGADGIAVMSAITKSEDPRGAAAALRLAFEEGRR